MAIGTIDLTALTTQLATRRKDRTEANVQSDLHTLLAAAPLNLDDDQLDDIVLEQPAGQRRRIDVEVGATVFEVKRDLRSGNVLEEAVDQLAGYVESRSELMGRRYVGVLTDGCDWHLYRHDGEGLRLTSSLTIDPAQPDLDRLIVWLEAVLATAEAIKPTPGEIDRKLGADSPGFALDLAELGDLYAACKVDPEVALKRELWSRLLFAALGTNFEDTDELFVRHTYLVLVAEVVAHAVVGIALDTTDIDVSAVLSGQKFDQAGIGGVVEADFFDWPADSTEGARFVGDLVRRIYRFDWPNVDHDVLKTLYESVIDDNTRHRLGEYYTPDWLAERVVEDIVDEPLTQRVLDPACGSGTFLFWAIRRFVDTAEVAGYTNSDAIEGVARQVVGIDLHPVAVTLARVTYLLAIGAERLRGDRGQFVVPVYLGDSIQLAEDTSILDAGGITIPTSADQGEFFARQIHFPADVVRDGPAFDALVLELADKARTPLKGGGKPSIVQTMNRAGVVSEHRAAIEEAYRILRSLHADRRNHIWGYYIRNLARPIWLSKSENRADRLVGNPPWLRYNAMTLAMQENFRRLSEARGLWAGGAVATSQDLASLFVARSVELYLRVGGRYGFVMPAAALSRSHYDGFRGGHWNAPEAQTCVAFDQPWELSEIAPQPFPMPASVVLGTKAADTNSIVRMPATASWAAATGIDHHQPLSEIADTMTWSNRPVAVDDTEDRGYYGDLMRQGSNLVPRVLLTVDRQQAPPLGLTSGTVAVVSRRNSSERPPWKDLASLSGVVEEQFVRRVHLGETLMPFRLLEPIEAVVPMADGELLLDGTPAMDAYPHLAEWWRTAEDLWVRNRREATKISLVEQINYQSKLANQYPEVSARVIYTGRGSRVAAAVETDPSTIVDHALYWAPVQTVAEGQYLTALLNSDALHEMTADFYSKGMLGARNIHKAAFGVPIPEFDDSNVFHERLVELAQEAEDHMAQVSFNTRSTSSRRTTSRAALDESGLMEELNAVSLALIGG